MNPWSPDFEEELALVLKDWLKQQGRTQADLRRSLRATSIMEGLETTNIDTKKDLEFFKFLTIKKKR